MMGFGCYVWQKDYNSIYFNYEGKDTVIAAWYHFEPYTFEVEVVGAEG